MGNYFMTSLKNIEADLWFLRKGDTNLRLILAGRGCLRIQDVSFCKVKTDFYHVVRYNWPPRLLFSKGSSCSQLWET